MGKGKSTVNERPGESTIPVPSTSPVLATKWSSASEYEVGYGVPGSWVKESLLPPRSIVTTLCGGESLLEPGETSEIVKHQNDRGNHKQFHQQLSSPGPWSCDDQWMGWLLGSLTGNVYLFRAKVGLSQLGHRGLSPELV